jgi:hypothetical protein
VDEAGFYSVGKLRGDANLRYEATLQQEGRGRPKKYGDKIHLKSDLSKWTRELDLEDGTEVYSSLVWSVCFKRTIKAVILRKKGNVKSQVLLFSTDINLIASKIIVYYKLRFQIEFIFRDSKQYTGLMDCQARCKEAVHTQINASLTCLNLLKLEDRNCHQSSGQKVISILSWKRKKFNQLFMKTIFRKLGVEQTSEKIVDLYEELSDYGAVAA